MVDTLHTKSTRADLRKAISSIPQEFSRGGVEVQAILTLCGTSILEKIKDAFLTKSSGGTDDAGDRWAPLKPTTIAYSRSGRTKAEKGRSTRPSQALNSRQQKRWWDLYRQGLAIYKGDKGSAAKRAWGILKSEGANTLINKYGGKRVDILYKTGGLYNSITSRVTSGGDIIVSSDHQAAAVHHNGSQTKGIPQRRLWPLPSRWPGTWWNDMILAIRSGIVEMIRQRVR